MYMGCLCKQVPVQPDESALADLTKEHRHGAHPDSSSKFQSQERTEAKHLHGLDASSSQQTPS